MTDLKDNQDMNTLWDAWRCQACQEYNARRTVCSACGHDQDGNDTRAPHYLPPAVRAYITQVTAGIPGRPAPVFSTFNGPVAYFVFEGDVITWDQAIGWQRGPHLDELMEFSSPHAHPDEVCFAITRRTVRDIEAWYCFEVPEWPRAHELPSQLGPSDCVHGAGPVRLAVDCEGCTAARDAVAARLSQLLAGRPADVIA